MLSPHETESQCNFLHVRETIQIYRSVSNEYFMKRFFTQSKTPQPETLRGVCSTWFLSPHALGFIEFTTLLRTREKSIAEVKGDGIPASLFQACAMHGSKDAHRTTVTIKEADNISKRHDAEQHSRAASTLPPRYPLRPSQSVLVTRSNHF